MEFNPNNNVIKLCIEAMGMEEKGKPEEASRLFLQAWNEATDDFEKFIAAYYVARHQKNVSDNLEWYKSAMKPWVIQIMQKGIMNWPYRSRKNRLTTGLFITGPEPICRLEIC